MDQSLGTKSHDNIIMPCKLGNTVFPGLYSFFVQSKEFDSTNGAEEFPQCMNDSSTGVWSTI